MAFSKLVCEEVTAYNVRKTDSSLPCSIFLCGAETKPWLIFYVTFYNKKEQKLQQMKIQLLGTEQNMRIACCSALLGRRFGKDNVPW